MARLFGTDGVRGEANVALCPELAYRLGWAAALYFGEKVQQNPLIIIGRDTRISGNLFESALATGICSAGGRVEIIGVCPTPAIAYLARTHKAAAGIVISASHNPFYDNGIKFFGGDGYKLPDAVEDEIESLVRRIEAGEKLPRATRENIGRIKRRKEYVREYIDFVQGTAGVQLNGLKVVLDCANGAAYDCMPRVLRRLGADVHVIHAEPDGININAGCGSTHPGDLQKAVLSSSADLGLAFDGDADRCLAVDHEGNLIDGDQILAILALALQEDHRLASNTVVVTVMSNLGLKLALAEHDIRIDQTKVGDRYVLESMSANGFSLGGEQSGHVIMNEFATTGDGVLTGLHLAKRVATTGKSLKELASVMTKLPQVIINVRGVDKLRAGIDNEITAAVADASHELGKSGRVLLRPSGTEPVVRVMVEAPTDTQAREVAERLAALVKKRLAI